VNEHKATSKFMFQVVLMIFHLVARSPLGVSNSIH
jgi:hypothetical protein